MIIVTREQMYNIEKKVMACSVPSQTLMENAGKNCAEWMMQRFDKVQYRNVLIFCGHGNNGGDGFVIARYLHENDYDVSIIFFGEEHKLSRESKINFEKCKSENIMIFVESVDSKKDTFCEDWSDKYFKDFYHIIIDAFFGIGYRNNLPEYAKDALSSLKYLKNAVKIAIDIPSGLDADTGLYVQNEISALDYTLTLGFAKRGLFLGKASDITGTVELIDIGLPLDLTID